MNLFGSRARTAAVLLVAGLLVAACSSPEDDLRNELVAEGLSESSADCIIDALEDAGVDLDSIDGLDDEAELPPGAEFAMSGCLAEVFGDMFAEAFEEIGAELSEGFADLESDLGSDGAIAFTDQGSADLGPLVASCEAGDNAACDELWLASPFDSEEERIAESCGGRSTEPRMGSCEFWLD